MEVIGVTVCVNFQDILQHVVTQNSKLLKEWLIITSPTDKATIEFIKTLNIENIKLLIYNDFYKNSKFNFGGSRRFAQEYLEQSYSSCNILFLDADIYLPDTFLEKLPTQLETNTLYGVSQRVDFYTLADFTNNSQPHPYKDAKCFYGFFQLYKQNSYKYNHSYNCSQCDTEFRDKFPNKINLDISVKHLGREHVHWNGRNFNYGKF